MPQCIISLRQGLQLTERLLQVQSGNGGLFPVTCNSVTVSTDSLNTEYFTITSIFTGLFCTILASHSDVLKYTATRRYTCLQPYIRIKFISNRSTCLLASATKPITVRVHHLKHAHFEVHYFYLDFVWNTFLCAFHPVRGIFRETYQSI